jgi:hypothetical protein
MIESSVVKFFKKRERIVVFTEDEYDCQDNRNSEWIFPIIEWYMDGSRVRLKKKGVIDRILIRY